MKSFIKAIPNKLMLMVLALAGTTSTALADAKLSIADFTARQGEAVTLEVEMTNTETNISEVQFDIVVPENMTLLTSSAAPVSSRIPTRGMTLQPVTKQVDNSYRFFINSAGTKTVLGTSGAIVTFKVIANSDLGYDPKVMIKNVSINDVTATRISATAQHASVTYEAASADVSFIADVTELKIRPGETKQIGISMENSRAIASMGAKITLPAGLEFGVDAEGEKLSYTDRIPLDAVFTLNEETGMFGLLSGSNAEITGTSGTLFYINVKATDGLAVSSDILVQSFVVGTASAMSFDLTDVLKIRVVDATEYNVTASVIPEGAGTVDGVGSVARGGTCTLKATANEGYEFTNWTVNGTVVSTDATYPFVPTGDVAVVANFAAKQYTVKFVIDGETVSEQLMDFGATITAPAVADKEGHSFSGWTPAVEATVPANDVTYTGAYIVNQYTVKFVIDGETVSEQLMDFGSAITAPTAPEKEGHSFSGWTPEVDATVPAKDVTYKGSYTVNKYTVKFVADGTTLSEMELEYGAVIIAPTAPEKEGYSFSGWTPEVDSMVPAKDVTYTAQYSVNQYTAKFIVDGTTVAENSIDFGAAITAPADPKKEGYTFTGWNPALDTTMPAKEMTYTATWKVNQYTVKFVIDGTVIEEKVLDFGAMLTPPTAPTKEGFTFAGWTDLPATMPAQDVTYIGRYTTDKFIVRFVADGATLLEKELEYGAAITAPTAPAKEGHSFSGWLPAVDATMPARDVTYTAQYTVNKYTVKFVIDGTTVKEQQLDYGAAIVAPTAPVKEGYTFSGWSPAVDATVPAKDVIYTGSYTVNKYIVKFVIDGTTISEQTLNYGAAITAPTAPAKEGHTFAGWSPAVDATVPAKDVTYTGSYTVNKYTVKFVIDGTTISEQTLNYGAAITAPTVPAKQGYIFSGWSPEVAATVPANDVTYTGSYILNEYTVKFVIDDVVIEQKTLTLGATITAPTAPAKEGYTFSGWANLPATMPAQDLTITGSYTINKYVVKFVVDGNTVFVQNMEYGARITAPEVEEPIGYVFTGWEPEVADRVPAHDVTYTGSLVLQDYTLTWLIDNEVYKQETLYYGAVIKAPAVSEREGYQWSGWIFLPEIMLDRNHVVRSYFQALPYTVTFVVDDVVIWTGTMSCGDPIDLPDEPEKEGYTFEGWDGWVSIVPAHDVTFTAKFRQDGTVGINRTSVGRSGDFYSIDGRKTPEKNLRTGIYINNGKIMVIK